MNSGTATGQLKLAASILDADFWHLEHIVGQLKTGGIDFLHMDVMDGQFVPEIFGSRMLAQSLVQRSGLMLEAHLMVANPLPQIDRYAEAGVQAIIVHYEACQQNLEQVLANIRDRHCRSGLAINPDTTLDEVLQNTPTQALQCLDSWLIMGVQPGYGGQELIPEVIAKIERLCELMKPNGPLTKIPVQIDGGVRKNNIGDLISAGVENVIAGSLLLGANDLCEQTLAIRQLLEHSNR